MKSGAAIDMAMPVDIPMRLAVREIARSRSLSRPLTGGTIPADGSGMDVAEGLPAVVAAPLVEIRLLGDLSVLCEGKDAVLPPSRKTRALLAYLAATERPVRRERLCEMFWEVPDDPRGALRWSLSRRLRSGCSRLPP